METNRNTQNGLKSTVSLCVSSLHKAGFRFLILEYLVLDAVRQPNPLPGTRVSMLRVVASRVQALAGEG